MRSQARELSHLLPGNQAPGFVTFDRDNRYNPGGNRGTRVPGGPGEGLSPVGGGPACLPVCIPRAACKETGNPMPGYAGWDSLVSPGGYLGTGARGAGDDVGLK